MTWKERLAADLCARCPAPAADGNHCVTCAKRQREHNRRSMAFNRSLRRELGLCVEGCGTASESYRCADCAAIRRGDACRVTSAPHLNPL